ncbi:hypothetical protein F5Y17DRAFT_436958 [Xylariaceae sp. FL0594]|nr:hypothetical protein F5Y17DRAFT_436958 [Xylariaceae sp. FL0594]
MGTKKKHSNCSDFRVLLFSDPVQSCRRLFFFSSVGCATREPGTKTTSGHLLTCICVRETDQKNERPLRDSSSGGRGRNAAPDPSADRAAVGEKQKATDNPDLGQWSGLWRGGQIFVGEKDIYLIYPSVFVSPFFPILPDVIFFHCKYDYVKPGIEK